MYDGLVKEDLVLLMLRRSVMGLMGLMRLMGLLRLMLLRLLLLRVVLLMMVMGQVAIPLRRHTHRRRVPPLCGLSLEACRLMRFALIST